MEVELEELESDFEDPLDELLEELDEFEDLAAVDVLESDRESVR